MKPLALVCAVIGAGTLLPTLVAQTSTGAHISGRIDSITIDQPLEVFSGGTIVVAGQRIIVPRNLVVDLPANRLTIQQLLTEAPPASLALGETGLASADATGHGGAFATILANRTPAGNVIAGDIFIEKGVENVTGKVTYINHTEGYLRIDGNVGDSETGVMIRINDPESRYTIQSGRGTDGGPNGSPDPRFGVDPDNYTITFSTGYPAGIPSTVPVGQRPGFTAGDNPAAASDANGVGDPFCPVANRAGPVAADSRRFAPIMVGDTINAEGNWEDVAGVRFISCHTLTVFASIATRNLPNQPDYMIFDEVEWDVAGFQNGRARVLMIGFTTLSDSQLDVYSLHIDPADGEAHEFPLASTVNNPDTINQGAPATAGGIFKIRHDLDFLEGVTNDINPRNSPAQNVVNAGFASAAPNGVDNFEDNFAIVSPISRDLIGRTRHKLALAPGVITRDINGNESPNGEYLTPVGIGYPEFVEIDLAALTTPFSFEGIPWLLDARISPGGFSITGTPQPLDPFPVSGLNPTTLTGNTPANIAQRVPGFFPFGPNNVLSMVPASFAPLPIVPARLASPTSLPPLAITSATFERSARGDGNVNVFVQSRPGKLMRVTLASGLSAVMREQQAGRYFVRLSFLANEFANQLTVTCLDDARLQPAQAGVTDVVDTKSATYSTGSGQLLVTASTSDQFRSPVLEAFADDGSSLGVLVRGSLSAHAASAPAKVTVRSTSGGADTRTIAVKVTR